MVVHCQHEKRYKMPLGMFVDCPSKGTSALPTAEFIALIL